MQKDVLKFLFTLFSPICNIDFRIHNIKYSPLQMKKNMNDTNIEFLYFTNSRIITLLVLYKKFNQ